MTTNASTTTTALAPSVTMATDKTQYVQGEAIELEVANGLSVPIWYIAYPQRDLVFWGLEKARDGGWERLDLRLPLIEEGVEVCRMILYERPVGAVAELGPDSRLLNAWNQKICPLKAVAEGFVPEMIERGRYRFVLSYSLDTVKSEDIESQPWKRPIELGETEVAYSNEFALN